jgi:hypothetical protein
LRLTVCATAVALLTACALLLPSGSGAAPGPLDYACEPPAPAAPANCEIWHTSPVTLHWLIEAGLSVVPGTDCTDRTIATDTTGTDVTCSVTSLLTGTLSKTATIRVDQTPPIVTGAAPDRPPDHNGWYNHPVGFSFAGSDATSGMAGCDSPVYSGPDTAAGQVTGTCRDIAGNTAGGSSPLMYDATAPTITPIAQSSPPGVVDLKWTGSPDVVEYSVTREPGRDGAPSSTVYTGTAPSYVDNNVAVAQSYTYTIAASDAAANSSSVVVVAFPGGSQMVLGTRESAPRKRPAVKPPMLRWRRVRSADYYNVQVFRGRRKILSAWPRRSRLQLHASWRFRGTRFHLVAGRRYHWYVWPGYGERRAHRYGRVIAHKRFTVRTSSS